MPSQDATRWWLSAEVALALAVIALPICLGGAPPWSVGVLLLLSVCSLFSWVMGAWRHRRRASWHSLLLLPLVMAGVALVSLVPLPSVLAALLSPANAELREFALVPLGLDGPRPITVDAPSTWRGLVRVVSLGGLAFVALQLGRVGAVKQRLLSVVALTGVLVAVVGLGHLLAGAETLFGVWRFYAPQSFLSFFGNTNHLAAYLALSSTVALGLTLDATRREVAIAWAAAAGVCGLGVFLSFSRGGIGAFVSSWALVGVLLLVRRQGGLRSSLPFVAIGAVTLFAMGLASEQLLERMASVGTLERLQKTKIELWPMFWDGAHKAGIAGMGLGAFELGFSRFQVGSANVTYTHPENLVLQWVAELGLPVALLLAALVVVIATRLLRAARHSMLDQILLVGVCGAMLHDLFDFALELNALPIAVVVVVGLVAAREDPSREPPRRNVHRALFLAPALVLTLGGLGVALGLPTHVTVEERLAELASRPADEQTFQQELRAALDRHPSDWVLYSIAASRSSLEAPRESLAWVNRVLFLHPGDSRAHVSAARALQRLGQSSQALLEFRVAWRLGDQTSFDEGLVLAAQTQAFDRLVGEERGLLSRAWNRYVALGRTQDARSLLSAVSQLPLSREVAEEARVLSVWQAQMANRPDEALTLLEGLPAQTRSSPELLVLEARLLSQVGRPDEGIALLEAHARKAPQDLSVAITLVQQLAAANRTSDARAVLERSRPFANGPAGRSELFQRDADLWVQDERWPRALEALQTASRIEPSRADLRYRIAVVYERMGSPHSALDEVRRGRLLDTAEGARAQDPWIARLEAALAGE